MVVYSEILFRVLNEQVVFLYDTEIIMEIHAPD
jgi:hypothetical protein